MMNKTYNTADAIDATNQAKAVRDAYLSELLSVAWKGIFTNVKHARAPKPATC